MYITSTTYCRVARLAASNVFNGYDSHEIGWKFVWLRLTINNKRNLFWKTNFAHTLCNFESATSTIGVELIFNCWHYLIVYILCFRNSYLDASSSSSSDDDEIEEQREVGYASEPSAGILDVSYLQFFFYL